MAEDRAGSVSIGMEAGTFTVDARPAVLVGVLPIEDRAPMAVAVSGTSTMSSVIPAEAKRLSFRLTDSVSIEASPASTFVAMSADDGRTIVSTFSGEVVVLPLGGDGERFAVNANEVLLAPAGATPEQVEVVGATSLSADQQGELDALMGAAANALGTAKRPAPVAPVVQLEQEPEPEPEKPVESVMAEPVEVDQPVEADQPVKADAAKPEPVKADATKAAATGAAAAAAAAASAAAKRGKSKAERKRERSEAAHKKATEKSTRETGSDIVPGATAPVPPASKPAPAAPTTPKKTDPRKKASAPKTPAAAAAGATAGKAITRPSTVRTAGSGTRPGGGPRSTKPVPPMDPEAAEDKRERRALPLMLLGGAVIAAAVVFFAARGNDDTIGVAAPPTTEAHAATSAPTSVQPSTTAKPTTTAKATTTAQPTTMAKAASQPDYAFVPKSCQQEGQQITYTAEITNKAGQPYNFTVKVAFKDSAGAVVAEATAKVDKLATGRTATISATGRSSSNLAQSGANCTVEKVDAAPA